MTIKELEERTGMTRANIRYYETEGFLSPERRENGYRDYSEEDLESAIIDQLETVPRCFKWVGALNP